MVLPGRARIQGLQALSFRFILQTLIRGMQWVVMKTLMV